MRDSLIHLTSPPLTFHMLVLGIEYTSNGVASFILAMIGYGLPVALASESAFLIRHSAWPSLIAVAHRG
jgi:hypothetical protein